jgi:hypothetical protein
MVRGGNEGDETMSKIKGEKSYAVKHVVTGQYLVATMQDVRINAEGVDRPVSLAIRWGEDNEASVLTHDQADRASAAYIALTGDKDVEIELIMEVL